MEDYEKFDAVHIEAALTEQEPAPKWTKPKKRFGFLKAATIGLASLGFAYWVIAPILETDAAMDRVALDSAAVKLCPQVSALAPNHTSKALEHNLKLLASSEYRNKSAHYLSGAVQIPTQSFDDLGPVGEDDRWDVFYPFAKWLKNTFPEVHKHLTLEKVNTHGLVYTWKGTNETLKPLLLMAHQDTVPVPKQTLDKWTHDPWSGHIDDTYVYGRGSSDCKNNLVGIMEAVSLLLNASFTPTRTILLSFGFDEEISGYKGAGTIAPWLEEKLGKDSLFMILDEGSDIKEIYGALVALPGTGEKGYIDVKITVNTPGGHSSIPPPHTSIGMLAEIITIVEADTYDLLLTPANPFLGTMQCAAAHSPDIPSSLRDAIVSNDLQDAAEILAGDRANEYLMKTSIAADVAYGGVKVNALPEEAVVVVNHRVAVEGRTQDVKDKLTRILEPIAKKHNLTFLPFTDKPTDKDSHFGTLRIETDRVLEPAPTSPLNSSAWSLLSGTIRHVFPPSTIVAPSIMTGNTDTKYFWNFTRNIYRFGPFRDMWKGNIHTVDEKASVKGHVEGVKFYHELIRNVQEVYAE
ncbi:hypothetical protein G7K_0100-t1 [Saitoella complicata NRRL Y-17804]|uniref:Peptidase M20 dimerisation domain-containing protein n=2 Tax=Saitoella complicata (strain BCRC 22490 / CBS 7301 / JCM 7358 / NBRC 10748 / NRRL Y-17804) TaxID=698492 RepID=A0A0E9N7E2_SAICN|nr:hypothetical protein G7K_0100-t1 [Saitoella complicata NRRL Y-17804]